VTVERLREWQVQRMHGYDAGTVHPTTDLVLSHKHPDDYRQVAATLAEQIAKDFLELSYEDVLPVRAVYGGLLLTAHLRIES
jgi:hypothetical protein